MMLGNPRHNEHKVHRIDATTTWRWFAALTLQHNEWTVHRIDATLTAGSNYFFIAAQ